MVGTLLMNPVFCKIVPVRRKVEKAEKERLILTLVLLSESDGGGGGGSNEV